MCSGCGHRSRSRCGGAATRRRCCCGQRSGCRRWTPSWRGRPISKPCVAAIYAGRLAHGQDVQEVARGSAIRAVRAGAARRTSQLLLRGLAVRLTDGYLAAAPMLNEALRRYRAQPQELDWLCVSYNLVAMDLWDDAGMVRARGRPGPAGPGERHPQLASVRARLPGREPHPGRPAGPGGGPADRAASGSTRGSGRPPCPTSRCCSPRGAGTRRPRPSWRGAGPRRLGPGRGRRADLRGVRPGGAAQRPGQLPAGRRGGPQRQRRRGGGHLALGAVRAGGGGGAQRSAGAGQPRRRTS